MKLRSGSAFLIFIAPLSSGVVFPVGGLAILIVGMTLVAGGCAPVPEPPQPSPVEEALDQWREEPVPQGTWRPHLLKRCRELDRMSPDGEAVLAQCWDLYQVREGSDAIMTLELYLAERTREGLILLALGQLYLMAGQGEPVLLPSEGPAADVGDWPRNKVRLLNRAEKLLREVAEMRPDDSAVEFLLADVARARGDSVTAHRADQTGLHKCTLPRSFEILRQFQELHLRPARITVAPEPDYPEMALQKGIQGEVTLDLLISPAGQVMQVETLSSPTQSLTIAASNAMRNASFEPARVGKYPIWAWLQVPTRFSIAAEGS